ncbi:MAG: hypothetical protein P8172_12535 [Gammaproteobacteria bacterium]|jgi:predicted small secreted protein
MREAIRKTFFAMVLASSLLVAGCSSNVGVGVDVDIPIGDHARLSFGTGRWY